MPKRLNKEERAERMRLYRVGCTDSEIAQKLGISRKAVSYWRTNNHLKMNGRCKYNGKVQLCWYCQNTSRYKCPWFDPDDPQPVEGWVAKPTKVKCVTPSMTYETQSYHIIECPNYIPEEVSS